MRVGNATVYVEQIGPSPELESDDRIYAVALPMPQEAFDAGFDVVKECLRSVGERIGQRAEKIGPDKLTVEFSITFEVKGKASLIPVFVTSESGAATGLKVTAEWSRTVGKDG